MATGFHIVGEFFLPRDIIADGNFDPADEIELACSTKFLANDLRNSLSP